MIETYILDGCSTYIPNEAGLSVWLIGDDGNVLLRFRLSPRQSTRRVQRPACGGCWRWLKEQPVPGTTIAHGTERCLFSWYVGCPGGRNPAARLSWMSYSEHDGGLSRSDILRRGYFHRLANTPAKYDTFSTGALRLEVRGEKIVNISALDTPWDLEPEATPLRIMSLEPDCDPAP